MLKYMDFKAYLTENEGQIEGYCQDVNQQWQVAHAEAFTQIEQGEPVTKLLACIHYALVMTSIQNWRMETDDDYEEQYYAISGLLNAHTPQANTIHDYLLNQLVPTIAPFSQILAYSDYTLKTEVPALKTTFLKAIESNLPLIKDPYQKSYAFYQLISAGINPAQNAEYFTRLHEAIETVADPWQQATLYRSIAQLNNYPEEQVHALQCAIEKILTIEDAYFKVSTLGSLVRLLNLTDDVKSELLGEIRATIPLIQSVRPRLQAFYVIYQNTSAQEQANLAQDILNALQNDLPTEYAKLGVIQYYGGLFTDKPRDELLKIARNFKNQQYRARALAVFMPDIKPKDTQTIQRDILDYLVSMSNHQRNQLLSLFNRRELFSAQIWGQDVTDQIAAIIAETCADWTM